MPGAMSGGGGTGPRARASATDFSNSLAFAGDTLATHAASIRATSSFCAARRSRSDFECFAKNSLPHWPLGAPYGRTVGVTVSADPQ